MNLFLAVLVVVAFAVILESLDLPERAREVGSRARDSLGTLRSTELDDRVKEKALQRQAVRLFGLLGILAGGSLLAVGLPLLGVWLLQLVGVASLDGVLSVLERLDFLAGATVIGGLTYLVVRRVSRRP